MKKVIIGTAFLFIMAIAFSSCKTHERCPAYSSADQIEQAADQS